MPSAMESPSERLEVDEIILDYLLWFCTTSLLNERRLQLSSPPPAKLELTEATRNSNISMNLVHSFFQTFTRLHPHHQFSFSLGLRLRTCRFIVLFLRRIDILSKNFEPDSNLRRQRTFSWLNRRGISSVLPGQESSFSASTPFSPEVTQKNLEHLYESLGHSPDAMFGSGTLRDALWEFILLATQYSGQEDAIGTAFIELFIGFMAQAALEAYRTGATGIEALNECFSFGLVEITGDTMATISGDELCLNETWAGDDGEVARMFEEEKMKCLKYLCVLPDIPLQDHYEHLASQVKFEDFEKHLLSFMEQLNEDEPIPKLAQLEQGKLDGYDDEEIKEVLQYAGIKDVWP
ncbi:hypothetical protein BZA77DRAFT_343461 [Pyronema omphalodes]|nr:hypothetical protein BZA77DRAFT_343461 [Pyronema omphalodes]